MDNKRADTFSFGLFVLFIGVLSLLANSGILTWAFLLDLLITYWPILIIVAGIKLVGDAQLKTRYFGIILDFILFACIILAAVFAKDQILIHQTTQPERIVAKSVVRSQYPVATTKEYILNFGAADLTVSDQTTLNQYALVSGPENCTVTTNNDRNDTTASITIKNSPMKKFLRFSNLRNPQRYSIELGVTELPASIDLTLGASKGKLLLEQTMLSKLSTTVGAGYLDITLSGNSITRDINLEVGAGKTTLRLIGETNVRVNYTIGAGNVTVNSPALKQIKQLGGLGTEGEYDVSPNPQIIINTSVGAGAVDIILE